MLLGCYMSNLLLQLFCTTHHSSKITAYILITLKPWTSWYCIQTVKYVHTTQ